ncbi:MAG: Uma2 family endonuclease [Cyanobacteriota bacterium]|nr:Uma2 family endonuclease [Cyanobacteriota bacterium]
MFQTDPPQSPKDVLPTMYDLPSEDPEEPGLPDIFHLWQPRLLDATFCPRDYPSDRILVAGDLNLYYDPKHPLWYKRPDWYAVLGVSRLYEERDLRWSYVIWQEGVNPFIVVELLSPGTEKEDLGQTLENNVERDADSPPTKWEVYEQILRVPYYVAFDRYTDTLRAFKLDASRYAPIEIQDDRFWMPELKLGLGVWQGEYQDTERSWLRYYDENGWVLTPLEKEQQRAQQLEAQLRALGIEPEV